MRRFSRTIATGAALGALAVLAAATPVGAQEPADRDQSLGTSRFSIEPYLAHYSVDVADDRESLGGFGVRVMLSRGSVPGAVRAFFNRARAGVFVTYTADQNNVTTLNVGGQGDFPLFRAPVVNGYLDPFVSLGLGAFRTKVDIPALPGVPGGSDATDTNFALSPGVGTLIPLFGAIAIRGDIQDVIVFGDETTNNFVFQGGLSIGF